MLHHEELFAGEECANGGEGHVGSGYSGLGVEGGKPLLREDSHADWTLLNRSYSKIRIKITIEFWFLIYRKKRSILIKF